MSLFIIISLHIFSVSYGNHGCNGGNMYNAYRYVVANEGVDTRSTYPFQGRVCDDKISPTT